LLKYIKYVHIFSVITSNIQILDLDDSQILKKISNSNEFNEDFLMPKISMLKQRLDDAQKTIQLERDEKSILHKNIEKISLELQHIQEKCEELRSAKQDAVRELLTQQEQHRAELRITNNLLQEETTVREAMERRLCELRTEVSFMFEI
jgi:coiled-coil domain-containing protein 102